MAESRTQHSIIGAKGFIGSHLADTLEANGEPVVRYHRDVWPEPKKHLGHLYYCIGPTGAAAGSDPQAAHAAHAEILEELMHTSTFDSLTYLSSTRLYRKTESTGEDIPIICDPDDPGDLFNLTKLAGETICLSHKSPTVRVVRLSNVIGKVIGRDTFLTDIVCQAKANKRIQMQAAAESAKDYIDIKDVVAAVIAIADRGTRRLYNVATGENLTQGTVAAIVAGETGAVIEVAENAPVVSFPKIDVSRLQSEFPFKPFSTRKAIIDVVQNYHSA